MYAQFFGLKQAPFSIAPDPRYLFMSERHREALAHLLYGVGGGGGFVVLTGEIGAGKTTVCRCFLEQIPRRCNVAYIFNPKLTVVELLQSVCDEFGIPHAHQGPGSASVKDYVDPLNEYLLKTHAVGQNNVLIIDEAQNLSSDVLEQLRLLTNLETNERKLLQIILIGQPELREMLARPELEQLAQRVIARFHLEALSETETDQYIQHRLSVAGLKRGRLFDDKAVRRIHQLTHGVPRRINLLCDRALLGAYAENKPRVDRTVVDKAAQEVFQTTRPAPLSPGNPAPPSGQRRQPSRMDWRPWLAGGLLFTVMAGLSGVVWFKQHQFRVRSKQAVAQSASSSSVRAPAAHTAVAQASSSVNTHPTSAVLQMRAAAAEPGPAQTVSAPQLLARAFRHQGDALRVMASLWQTTLPESADACLDAPRAQLACFRTGNGLAEIRQLDRPAVLLLHGEQDVPLYAVLRGIKDQAAILQLRDQTVQLPLLTLSSMWRGDFITLWRVPPGYHSKILPGQRGQVVNWLADQMARIDKGPASVDRQVYDGHLQARVYAFQMAQGLKQDGVVGATTFMQINRSVGIDEPRLQSGAPNAR